MDSVIGRPISLSLDVSLLSERVLNVLSKLDRLTREDKDVLKKAAGFLSEVQRGGAAVHRLELGVTTSREIESFGLATNAYKQLSKRGNSREYALRIKEINNLLETVNKLAEDINIPVDKINDLREFFLSAKAITKHDIAGEIDRVNIG
jgi:hypothetical protein